MQQETTLTACKDAEKTAYSQSVANSSSGAPDQHTQPQTIFAATWFVKGASDLAALPLRSKTIRGRYHAQNRSALGKGPGGSFLEGAVS